MGNIIAVAVIVLVIGGALAYIITAKKKGQKCIGCPHSKECSQAKKEQCNCK